MAKGNITEIVARTRNANHPTGGFNRAGIRFTTQPQTFQVTDEQLAAIEAEPLILIEDNPKRIAQLKKDGVKGGKKVDEDVVLDDENDGKDSGQEDDEGSVDNEKISKMKKSELVEALEAKGLVDGKDFDSSANKDALAALLSVS